jgi:hypothetical protein
MKYAFAALLFMFLSCKNASNPPQTTVAPTPEPLVGELPADFSEFYQLFHSDSLFQVEHTVFPLQGLPDNADSATVAAGNFYWTPENWIMQRSMDFEMSEFKRELIPVNEMMVVEHILNPKEGYGMVRRFHKMSGEWHLIYYAGMNRLSN